MAMGAAGIRAQICALAAVCWSGTAPGIANASPWTRIDGEALVISRTDYFHADLTPQDPAGGSFRAFTSDTYIEYGLTDNIMLGGKVAYGSSWLLSTHSNLTSTGFSELEGFLQYQLIRNERHAASLRVSSGRPAAFHPDARNDLKTGGADVELAALYGNDLFRAPLKVFVAAEIGYRKRIGPSADIIKTQFTLGVEPSPRWVFMLEGFSTTSLRNAEPGGGDYDLIKLQPSLLYRFNHRWAVQGGMSQDVSARNLSPGRSYFISLWSAF